MKKAKARRPTNVRLSPKLWPTSGLMAPMTLVMSEMTKKVSITRPTMPAERRVAGLAGGREDADVAEFSFMACTAFFTLLYRISAEIESRQPGPYEESAARLTKARLRTEDDGGG